jgi:uncharacterized protein YbaA (DUF1428 family)
MGHYVDGFILPVPKKKRSAYLKMARLGKKVWSTVHSITTNAWPRT